jgi:hypothetical protein
MRQSALSAQRSATVRLAFTSFRFYSRHVEKPLLMLVPSYANKKVSITKVREALAVSNNDVFHRALVATKRPRRLRRKRPPKSRTAQQARALLLHPSSLVGWARRWAACATSSSDSTARRTLWRAMHSFDVSWRTWRIPPLFLAEFGSGDQA